MKLEDIERLVSLATPGPWINHYRPAQSATDRDRWCFVSGPLLTSCNEDREFVAASRTLMPKLLAVACAAFKMAGKKSNPQFIPEHLKDLWEALEELENEK